jgi:predicted phosphodiesterase
MRVAVLSDIHGNWFALLSVLNDALQEDVDQVWCLGDVAGYGPYSLECYEELRDLERRWHISLGAWVAGNHDWGLAGRIPLEDPLFRPEAKWALQQTKMLAATDEEAHCRFGEMCAFLAQSPTFTESPQAGVWLMHGRVTNNEQGNINELSNVTGRGSYIRYVEEDAWKAERSWEMMSDLATDETHRPGIILAGHTHEPLLWCRSGSYDWREDPPQAAGLSPPAGWLEGCPKCGQEGPCRSRRRWEQSIVLPREPVLINPGSVGQPRDGCPAAAYVVLDFEKYRTQMTFKRVGYQVQATVDSLARLATMADGRPDPRAMRTYVETLRTTLTRGEGE